MLPMTSFLLSIWNIKVIKMKRVILHILIITAAVSCRNDEMSRDEFANWWGENADSFQYTKDLGDVKYTAIVLPNLEGLDDYTRLELRIQLPSNDNVMYHNVQNDQEITERISYFQKDFKEGVLLKIGESELSCMDVHLQTTSGITPYTSLVLLFDHSLLRDEKTIIEFRDELFLNGIIRIKIKNLEKIPRIKRT